MVWRPFALMLAEVLDGLWRRRTRYVSSTQPNMTTRESWNTEVTAANGRTQRWWHGDGSARRASRRTVSYRTRVAERGRIGDTETRRKMKEFDIHIKGGTIVDGTRVPRYRGDVWIRDGRIAQLGGRAPGKAARTIDAEGHIVAPGFVDLHTHYDAQIRWDPWCSCSGWHGVTSVVLGNCGFGFAPGKPAYRDRSMLTMTRNEAIPFESYVGKSVEQIAAEEGKDVIDAMFDLSVAGGLDVHFLAPERPFCGSRAKGTQ